MNNPNNPAPPRDMTAPPSPRHGEPASNAPGSSSSPDPIGTPPRLAVPSPALVLLSLFALTAIMAATPACTESGPEKLREDRWVDLTLGVHHSCALRGTGEVVCWGSNSGPIMGTFNQSTPPAGVKFEQISAGHFHNCGITKEDGAIICWGDDAAGQSTPPAGLWSQVSSGGEYTCAIKEDDGSVSCWGSRTHNRTNPPQGRFLQVSAGTFHACGIKDDQTITCWGYNASGQANPPQGTFKHLSVGDQHVCAIKTDDSLVCWGENSYNRSSSPGGQYLHVAAGQYHSCGVKGDGSLVCWGENSTPLGTWYGMANPPKEGKYIQVATGSQGFHSCAIAKDGEAVTCWGDDQKGQSTPLEGNSTDG